MRLYVVADVHLGNRGCAEDAFRRYLERIAADPGALWIGLGDYVDAIGFRDRRFDPEGFPEWVKLADLAQLGERLFAYFAEMVRPIAGQCVGLGWGNHEDQMLRDTESGDRWQRLLTSLGVADLGLSAFVDLMLELPRRPPERIRIATHHGAGWAQTAGGKLNRLRSFLVDAFPHADLVLTGHVHEQLDHRVCGVDADESCQEIRDMTRLGVSCGTWLRTYALGVTGYAERRGYRPVALGNPCVIVYPETRHMAVEWC